jgi:hypothetical protein
MLHYCNGYTRMFQVYVPNVSSVPDACCKYMFQVFQVFHTYIASVHLGVAYVQWFSSVFMRFASVLDVCFRCFICLLLYVATVAFGCFKCRSECCIWDARGKRMAARAIFEAAWATSGAAHSLASPTRYRPKTSAPANWMSGC